MQAVRINDIGSIEQLLERNSPPDCNQKDKHGYTPLHYAAKFNRCRIFELLLMKGKAGIIMHINSDV
jgi:ankyrin repeat protein